MRCRDRRFMHKVAISRATGRAIRVVKPAGPRQRPGDGEPAGPTWSSDGLGGGTAYRPLNHPSKPLYGVPRSILLFKITLSSSPSLLLLPILLPRPSSHLDWLILLSLRAAHANAIGDSGPPPDGQTTQQMCCHLYIDVQA